MGAQNLIPGQHFQHTFWITPDSAGMQPILLSIIVKVTKTNTETFPPLEAGLEDKKINQIFKERVSHKWNK